MQFTEISIYITVERSDLAIDGMKYRAILQQYHRAVGSVTQEGGWESDDLLIPGLAVVERANNSDVASESRILYHLGLFCA